MGPRPSCCHGFRSCPWPLEPIPEWTPLCTVADMTNTQRPKIMGILNVTPDSFSDGGRWQGEAALEARIRQMIEEGADIIDVGGESTRPFARPVGVEEELARVVPAIRKIRQLSDLPVSIDTAKAAVARAALAEGATMLNDISALRHDPAMIAVVRSSSCPVVLMHMQGTPGTMQIEPRYTDVVAEINAFFRERIGWLEEQGVDRRRLIIDPGIGFGKSLEHNLSILKNIPSFKEHRCPVLIGHSRKSFLGQVLDCPLEERDCPTAVVSALCMERGVDILRVHAVRLSRMATSLSALLAAGR